MLRELTDDFVSRMDYRIAYGEADRLAEMVTFDHGWGWDFAAQVGGEAYAIEKEVVRRLPGAHPKIIKLAVRDVMEPRKPRW